MKKERKKKTHCEKGHEYTEENTIKWEYKRLCRTCRRANLRRQYLKNYKGDISEKNTGT